MTSKDIIDIVLVQLEKEEDIANLSVSEDSIIVKLKNDNEFQIGIYVQPLLSQLPRLNGSVKLVADE